MDVPIQKLKKEEIIKKYSENEEKLVKINKRLNTLIKENNSYKDFFNFLPTPTWKLEITSLIRYLTKKRGVGIQELNLLLNNRKSELLKCAGKIKILDVNKSVLELHKADTKKKLLNNLDKLISPSSIKEFKRFIAAVNAGEKKYECLVKVKTLENEIIDLQLQVDIFISGDKSSTSWIAYVSASNKYNSSSDENGVLNLNSLTIDDNKTENQLNKVKEQLEFAINGSGAGLWDWYIQSGKCLFSEQWAEMIGYKLNELEPLSIDTWVKMAHPDDLKKSNELLEKHFSGKTTDYVFEGRMKHKNGNWIWVLDRGRVIERDKNGAPYRMVGTHIDITQLKETEKALRKSEQKYRLLVEHQTDLVVEVDTQNKFTFVSPSYCKMFGKSESELVGNSFYPLIHEDDRESTMREMEKLKIPPFACRIEQRALTSLGWKWLEWNDTATVDSQNRILSVIGVGRDITDKKNAEEALKLSEEKFIKLFKYSPNLLIISSVEDGTITEINEIGLEILGLPRDEIINKTSLELGLIDKEGRDQILDQIKEKGQIRDLEIPVKLPSGELRIGLFHGQLITISDKNYIFQTIADITDRKRTELAIEEKEENLRAIINTSADSVIMLGTDGTIIEANRIFASLLNLKKEEIIGTNIFDYVQSEQRKEHKKLINRILNLRQPDNFIDFNFNKTWEFNIRPILNQKGDVTRITVFARDITEKYIYEEKLKKTNEKLRNLSRHINIVREEERKNISREVHDNLGQKLTALNLEISWIKQNLPDNLTDIKNQFDDMMELVNQSIITVQEISTELRPGILDDLGLANAIQWQCNKISRKSKLRFHLDLLNEEVELSDEIKTVLFRVFQEALTNIIRHSKAKNISVNLRVQNEILIFEIIDDGIGIPTEKQNDFSSFGIIGMRERIDSIHGSFFISEGKSQGTLIKIQVPLAEV